MISTASLQSLYAPIAGEMDAVRESVAQVWRDAIRHVHGQEAEPPAPGGKLLRPALCMMSAGAMGAQTINDFVPLAASMELLHMAALAHDDVIDDSDMRRGMSSWNAQWDNHTAVLGGDYLVARAISKMGKAYDKSAVILNAIDSVRMMAEGELVNFGLGPDRQSQEACISLARQKTASLFAVSCSTPAYLVNLEHRDALHTFGMELGVAFQLADDILDLVQNPETLGKPACGDVVEGKKTLPIILLREASSVDDAARIDAMKGSEISDDDRDWIAERMEVTGVSEKTAALANEYCENARTALAPLPSSTYKDAMLSVVDFVVARES